MKVKRYGKYNSIIKKLFLSFLIFIVFIAVLKFFASNRQNTTQSLNNSGKSSMSDKVRYVTPRPFTPVEVSNGKYDPIKSYRLVSTNSAAVKAILHSVHKGVISFIDTSGGYNPELSIHYILLLFIKGKGDIESDFYFSKEDMAKVKIVELKGNREVPISMNDLKLGDSIYLELIEDRVKPTYNNVESGKITRL